MIQIIKADQRHFSDRGWLQSYWLFSFDYYYDPNNVQFGALRVFNDDVIHPGRGFPAHPHEEMEIITIPRSGEITHEDSIGNRTVVRAGDVQRMSAGAGVTHSEMNQADVPVHLYQIWIIPGASGLTPSYDQRSFDPSSWKNRLFPIASGQGISDVVTLNADATIYRAFFPVNEVHAFPAGTDRRIFIYLTSGILEVDDHTLYAGDQARIDEAGDLRLGAIDDTEFVLIDVPSAAG